MGVPPDSNAQTAGTRVEELAQRLAHLDAQSQENARLRRSLEAEDRDLAERERDVEARIREARAGLARAQQMQPLHDLIGLARDCAASQVLLTLLDATIARDGSVVAWVTDGLPNYLSTSGRTWRISDFGEARRLWPHLPDQWRGVRRGLGGGRWATRAAARVGPANVVCRVPRSLLLP